MTRIVPIILALCGVPATHFCSPVLAEPEEDEPVPSVSQIEEAIQRNVERVRAEEGRDGPVPGESEVVMSPGMRIIATTPAGTITITAGKGLKRSFSWDGATRSVEMWPREKRWYGSLGLYFPGSGHHWREHNGITRAVVNEGQQHFESVEEALKWINMRKGQRYIGGRPAMQFVYRNDGLMIGFGKTLERNQLNVDVWQIFIDGNKPTKLEGSDDDKIVAD